MRNDCLLEISDKKLCAMVRAALSLDGFSCTLDPSAEYLFVIDDEAALKLRIQKNNIPDVVVLICKDTSESVELVGAADESKLYVLDRPFSIDRLNGIARELIRGQSEKQEDQHSGTEASSIKLLHDGTVIYGDKRTHLTDRELLLFGYLYKNRGRIVSRDEIMQRVWGETTSTNVSDVYISYLRKKLEPMFGAGVLVSVRGRGYLLKLPLETKFS